MFVWWWGYHLDTSDKSYLVVTSDEITKSPKRLLRSVFRRACSAGHCRFPPRIQGGWPTRGCMRRFTARL